MLAFGRALNIICSGAFHTVSVVFVYFNGMMPPATPKSTHFLYHDGNRGKDSLPSFPQAPIRARAVWASSETFLGGFWVLLLFLLFLAVAFYLVCPDFVLEQGGEKVYGVV